jgi:GT2 family glycosyltransferase
MEATRIMKRVALLVPVFNNLEFTKNCLRKLDELLSGIRPGHIEYSVIIIDDGSKDGTSAWIKANFPDVMVLQGDGNLWWSGGVNMGAAYAINHGNYEYVLLWNNDIQPADNYFAELNSLIPQLTEDTIVGSKIYNMGSKNIVWSFGGRFNPWSGRLYMLGYEEEDGDKFTSPVRVDWLPGMGTLVPRKVIEKIGYWDAVNFPQYHGDSDFTYRARLSGFELKVYPQLKIWNNRENTGLKHEGSFKKLRQLFTDTKSNFNWKMNMLFYRKYSKSIFAYIPLLYWYATLVGGFFKWKILEFLGVSRHH